MDNIEDVPVVLPELRGPWSFTLRYGQTDSDRPTSITVEAPEGQVIDAAAWRAIRIGRVLSKARSRRIDPDARLLTEHLSPPPARPHVDAQDYPARIDRHRERVRLIYRIALSRGINPAEAVAEHFDSAVNTAERWIADARRAGYLRSYREESAEYRDRDPLTVAHGLPADSELPDPDSPPPQRRLASKRSRSSKERT